MEQNKYKIIKWIIDEASDRQIEALEQVIYEDYNYAIELFMGVHEYKEWIKEIEQEAVEEYKEKQGE